MIPCILLNIYRYLHIFCWECSLFSIVYGKSVPCLYGRFSFVSTQKIQYPSDGSTNVSDWFTICIESRDFDESGEILHNG